MVALAATLGALIPQFGIDVVSVYTLDFTRVFPDAHIIKANIKEESKLMEHPLETGAVATDHRIILPVEIELSIILSVETYRETYKAIKQLYTNATLLTVQTKADVYESQLIQGLPHDEDASLFDTIAIALKLKEVLFVKPEYGLVPRNATQKSTVDKGTQQGKVASAEKTSKSSAAFKAFKKLS